MEPVSVRILHPEATASTPPLERALAIARAANAERLAATFHRAGATDVRIAAGPPDRMPFGARLRDLLAEIHGNGGLVVLGSGAIPLATGRDAAAFLAAAGSGARRALANTFYSADVVAIGRAAAIRGVPGLATDNELPRWLAEQAGFAVGDLRRRWRLGMDLDSPLDAVLAGLPLPADVERGAVEDRLAALRALVTQPRRELVVAGRTSSATLRWLERETATRTRALVEERGLRSAPRSARAAEEPQRPPRSVLGLVLDHRGPEALGAVLGELGDGAVLDTRVLLAHRFGADDAAWPRAEDRFASDMLLPESIADPWLRALTASARDASIPVLLGGHTLVGPGIRLALRRGR